MEPAGDHTEPVMTKASVLPRSIPHWCSPTCQETKIEEALSSASTGGLSEVVFVHPLMICTEFDLSIKSMHSEMCSFLSCVLSGVSLPGVSNLMFYGKSKIISSF